MRDSYRLQTAVDGEEPAEVEDATGESSGDLEEVATEETQDIPDDPVQDEPTQDDGTDTQDEEVLADVAGPTQEVVAYGAIPDRGPVPSVQGAIGTVGIQDALPSSYRADQMKNYVTPVRDQNPFSNCWAFSTIAAIESSMLKKGPNLGYTNTNLDLAERHLAYFTYNRPADPLGNTVGDTMEPVQVGYVFSAYAEPKSYVIAYGNGALAANALWSLNGAALEESYPYSAITNNDRWASNYRNDPAGWLEGLKLSDDDAFNGVARLKDLKVIRMSDAYDVKRNIMEYGGAAALVNASDDYIFKNRWFDFENSNTNHMVEIVGWDDNFDRANFAANASILPKHNGAWLCKNSWGRQLPYLEIGEYGTGYVWISYEDVCLSQQNAYFFEMESAEDYASKYDNLYQYDGTTMDFGNYIESGGSIANVFQAKACDTGEILNAVSFFLWDTKVDYQLQVYLNPTNPADPTSGMPQLSPAQGGTSTYAGIHRVELKQPVTLSPGDVFSVVLTLSHADGTRIMYIIDASTPDGYWFKATHNVKPGQSFEKDTATARWDDLSSATCDAEDEPKSTARIKAHTKNTVLQNLNKLQDNDSVTGVSDKTYTGSAIEQDLTVTYGGTKLAKDTDYVVIYQNNVNVGTASVVVRGIGDYYGSVQKTFAIRPVSLASASVSPIANQTYSGKASTPKPSVTLAGKTLREGTDYTLSYANNTNVGTAAVTVTGKGNYTGTKSATFKISPATITSVAVSQTSYTFDGTAKKPGVTVKASSLTVPGSGYTVSYRNNVNTGTATVTVTGKGNFAGTMSATFTISNPTAHVAYRTHVQSYGWQAWRRDGAMSGTSGEAKRLEGINVKLEGAPYSGGIEYRTHVQKYGWQSYRADGAMSGTSGGAKRLEAIQIRLTGEMARRYDVWYRVHAQTYGWLGWARNDSPAGTAGLAKRLEGIEVRVLPKGSAAPGQAYGAFVSATGASPAQSYAGHLVSYRTHVQSYGWQAYVADGQSSGTSGLAKRLEGINIRLQDAPYSGGVEYRTHVQTYGWQAWKSNGQMSGTSGESKRLEAIQIRLTGEMASRYDVWYRVHAQTFGWMGWAKDGAQAGTAGYGKRLEAIQILVLPKGSAAPGPTASAFRQR